MSVTLVVSFLGGWAIVCFDVNEGTCWISEFADELKKARTVGSFTKFVVGRSSAATFTDAFKKQEAIIRYLASCDPSGEVSHYLLSNIMLFKSFLSVFFVAYYPLSIHEASQLCWFELSFFFMVIMQILLCCAMF